MPKPASGSVLRTHKMNTGDNFGKYMYMYIE